MIKKGVLFAVMLFALAISVSAVGNLAIVSPTTALSANATTSSVTGSFVLNNTGATNLTTIGFTSTQFTGSQSNISSSSISFSPSSLALLNSSEQPSFNYTITLPSSLAAGSYVGTINATDSTGNHSDTFSSTLTVSENHNVTASSPSVSAIDSLSGTASMTLTNNGNVAESGVTFSASTLSGSSGNISSSQVSFSPSSVTVPFGGTTNTNVTVAVPNNTTAGTYTGNITTTFNGTQTTVSTLTLTVTAQAPSVTLTTPNSANWIRNATTGSKQMTFNVTNNGNVALGTIALSIGNLTSGSNTLGGSISLPTSISSLAVGASTAQTITVSGIPATQAAGTYTGIVKADFGGSTNATSTATVVVEDPRYDLSISASQFPQTNVNSTSKLSFTLSNAGNLPMNNLLLTNVSIAGKYNFSLNVTSIPTLAANGSVSIEASIFLAESETSGIENIGKFKVTATEYSEEFELSKNARGRLLIKKLEVKVEDSSEATVSDGQTIGKSPRPGDDVRFKVEVENGFPSSSKIDIDDIEITVTIDGIDDGDEIELVSPDFNLGPDKSKTKSLEFTIPYLVDETSYDVTILVEGTDENGNDHSDEISVTLDVDKKNHGMVITKTELVQDTVSACSSGTSLSLAVVNIGSDDEDEARVTVKNSDLGLNFDHTFELDASDDEDARFSRTIDVDFPSDVTAKTYPLEVKAYIDSDKQMDAETVNLVVTECRTPSTTTSDTSGSAGAAVTVLGGTDTTGTSFGASAQPVPTTVKKSGVKFTEGTGYVVLLALVNLAIIILGAVLVFKYLL